MKTFAQLITQETNLLTPLVANGQSLAGAVIVVEDTADVNAEIQRALGIGLMIFIGIPEFDVAKNLAPGSVPANLSQQILIGEVPALWRNTANAVHCQDAARIVAAALHGQLLDNNQRLHVIHGRPFGNFKGDPEKAVPAFQYYLLELEVPMQLTAT